MNPSEHPSYRVFVYGSLKSGFHNHALLAASRYLGTFTTPALYTMYNLGEFPAVAKDGGTAIYGEVYEVSHETLTLLDRLEGHPEWYCRSLITTDYGDSYIYLIQENTAAFEQVKDGVWAV